MTSAAGRATISYIVRCALPAGRSIVKKDQRNFSYTFSGRLGVAPEWETGACGKDCQELVSACVLAHVNTTGKHIQLWLDSDSPAIGWGRSTDFPYQEGSFFGNIFESPPSAYFCNGKDFDQGAVPGRLGVGQGSPFTNPFGNGAYCKDRCTAADIPNADDGYKACAGFNHVITVWRNFDPNINYKVCSRNNPGKCLDVTNAATADGARLQQYDYYGGKNQTWRIRQVSPGQYTFMNVNSGKFLDILGAWTGNGAQLVQWTGNGAANQHWSFTPTGDGYYKFSAGSQPSSSIEVPNGVGTNGAFIQQWAWTGSPWQQWSIVPAN